MAIITLGDPTLDEIRLSIVLEHADIRCMLEGRPFVVPAVPTRPDIGVVAMAVDPAELTHDPAMGLIPRTDGTGWLLLVQSVPDTWREMLGAGSAESALELYGETHVDDARWHIRVYATPSADVWLPHARRTGHIGPRTRVLDQRLTIDPSLN